jgi:hypothetical protein
MLADARVVTSGTPWPDIVVAAIVAYLVISAVKVPRQTVGEMHGVHVLQGAPGE